MLLASILANKASTVATVAIMGTATAAAATGVALQEPAEPQEPTLVVVVEDETPIEDVVETVPDVEIDIDDPDGDESTTDEAGDPDVYEYFPCEGSEKNHGQYVSGVARADLDDYNIEGNRGSIVSQAAQTDCGKPDAVDDDDLDEKDDDEAESKHDDDDADDEDESKHDDDDDDDDDEDEKDDDEDDESDRPGNAPDRGENNGKGKDKDK